MKTRSWLSLAAVVGVAPTLLWSCATIIHGSHQEVGINSQPAGAKVAVDDQAGGITPVVAKLTRKDTHKITITMDGYQPYQLVTTRSVSGWIAGNILFGGLIGLAVDAISGGMYNVKPDEVQAQLAKAGASRGIVKDGSIYVFLVRQADPSWQKIGQLEPVRGPAY